MLVYDIEIAKPIPPKDDPREKDLDYCEGWGDHLGMGIAVVGVYDYVAGMPRMFCKDNIQELWEMMEKSDANIGFNSQRFDDKIMAAHGFEVPNSYDIFLEIKKAAGAGTYAKGYNLENICQVLLGQGKTGASAQAPALWQRGKIGEVIDCGLRDVMLTKMILDQIIAGPILDPAGSGTRLFVKPPL